MQHYDRKEEDMSYEEPLDLPTLDGGGYYPCAMLGCRIAARYQIVRKVCVSSIKYRLHWYCDSD